MLVGLLDEFTEGKLTTLVRTFLDFEHFRSGEDRNKIFVMWGGAAAALLEQRQVEKLIARPVVRHSPAERAALEAVLSVVVEEEAFMTVIERFKSEALRRDRKGDFNGKHAPSWLKRGVVPSSTEPSSTGLIESPAPSSVSSLETIAPGAIPEVEQDFEAKLKVLSPWADQMGITQGSSSQRRLLDIAGNYLIIRCLFTTKKFIVSHMQIDKPLRDDLPTFFRTWGGEGVDQHDFRKVEGVAFAPSGSCDLVSVGRIGQEINLRAALLTRSAKRTPLNADLDKSKPKNFDLSGIRISPGSRLREQVASRIWCSKIIPGYHDMEILHCYDTFDANGLRQTLAHKIDDFERIFDWVTEIPTMTCAEDVPPYN